ncbi:type II toxin-antitoxin system RelE/ParE family toxin [Suttonella ornithocola]|uniref:Toxin higB-1 n=1 Tax=Suttonella ornithocola TaxID=279832 RepID=A0A380MXG4_9GAMM|nr:type II toxin-antitoxin system RelE/ParE family toxin [Suttonella ornithocola]SUO96726.1 Toxin higB-1 [Suttonella ornithocola]
MIHSFKDREAQKLFNGLKSRYLNFEKVATRKLAALDEAVELEDLRIPPGNMLEALGGDRKGQYSIRINRQFRICFRWDEGAHDVEITDYH